jgi:hypothetical protein
MPADSTPRPTFDPSILAQLACPACYGDLHTEAQQLVCANCGSAYPVVDRIPVLIIERSEKK